MTSHHFFKSEHSVVHQVVAVGIVRVGVVTVKKLNDMKTAAIDVKVDIALFKVRCDGFPYLHLRINPLNFTPCGIADTLAVDMRRYKQQLQIALVTIHTDNSSACDFSVTNNTVRVSFADCFLYRCAGDDLAVFLIVFVTQSELLDCAVVERLLIVKNELLSVISL